LEFGEGHELEGVRAIEPSKKPVGKKIATGEKRKAERGQHTGLSEIEPPMGVALMTRSEI
jgi:hypothetical protein